MPEVVTCGLHYRILLTNSHASSLMHSTIVHSFLSLVCSPPCTFQPQVSFLPKGRSTAEGLEEPHWLENEGQRKAAKLLTDMLPATRAALEPLGIEVLINHQVGRGAVAEVGFRPSSGAAVPCCWVEMAWAVHLLTCGPQSLLFCAPQPASCLTLSLIRACSSDLRRACQPPNRLLCIMGQARS